VAHQEPREKFCGECGPALGAATEVASAARSSDSLIRVAEAPAPEVSLDGERKKVTALFADIRGSMELIEDLDPEEAPIVPACVATDCAAPGSSCAAPVCFAHYIRKLILRDHDHHSKCFPLETSVAVL
jgi:hypothetical protein